MSASSPTPGASPRPAERPRPRRPWLLILVAMVIVATVIGGAVVLFAPFVQDPVPVATRTDPRLPDLAIAPFSEVAGARDANTGQERLRFGVSIVNVGDGDFGLRARRSNAFSDDWVVTQHVVEGSGGFTATTTPATLVYGGDGHDHWHVRGVENHRLETLDGEVLGEVVKQGYCFFDTDPYPPAGLPADAVARYHAAGCGGQLDPVVTMGLSVGWGDEYPWHMFDQQIVIDDVPDGRYRLHAIADPFGQFEETDETNNDYWEIIDLTRDAAGIPEITVVERADPVG